MELIEKIFKLKENNSTIKTELIAGLTTFFTMSYMLIISPKLLEIAGLDLGSSITVTGIIIFICSINKIYDLFFVIYRIYPICFNICHRIF